MTTIDSTTAGQYGTYDPATSADDTLSGLTSALSNTVDVTVGTVGHGHHHSDIGHS
jgi:hypothetical protein